MPARRREPLVVLLALGLSLVACGSGGDGGNALPSGSLGPVTPQAVVEAVRGLCQIVDARDLAGAEATFLDRSHATLHVIAAATEVRDRSAAATLLEAKQRVEADLAAGRLRPGFASDVRELIDATRAALDAIGLGAPPCPV